MPYSHVTMELRRRYGFHPPTSAEIIRGLVEIIKDEVARGQSVDVPGLGTIQPLYQAPKTVVSNLPTLKGKTFRVPLRVRPFLRPSPALLREVPVALSDEERSRMRDGATVESDERLSDVLV